MINNHIYRTCRITEVEENRGFGRIIHIFFVFYTLWFCIELLSYFILLLNRLGIISLGEVAMTVLGISFISFHVVSLVLTVPVLIHYLRNGYRTDKNRIVQLLFIIFFGMFGLAIVMYYWMEIKEDDDEVSLKGDLLI
jgi:hypothetical protein